MILFAVLPSKLSIELCSGATLATLLSLSETLSYNQVMLYAKDSQEIQKADEELLASLGYKQEFKRAFAPLEVIMSL